MSYPENLLYFVKKLQGYSRNNVKVLPLTSTTSGNGQVIQFRLPTNSLIDLSTFCMHGQMKVTGSTQPAVFGRDSVSMIRSMQIQIGGQTIQNLNHYNLVWQGLKQSTMSLNASMSNKTLEYDADVVLPTGSSSQTTASSFAIRNWLGFMQVSPSILDSSLTGEIVISLTVETDGFNYAVNKASCTGITLALSDLYSSIDVISIQDGVYDLVAQQALASGLTLELPVPNYFTFLSSQTGDSYQSSFTIGCQSLDAAMVLQRVGRTFATNSTALVANTYKIQSGMRFNGANASESQGDGWYFNVNGSQVPSHRINKFETPYYQKLAFGIHGSDHGNLHSTAITRPANATVGFTQDEVDVAEENQYIPVVRFNHASSDKRLLSGIDARSNPVQIQFTHSEKAGATAAAKDVCVVALCTSTLMLGAGQQLSFAA